MPAINFTSSSASAAAFSAELAAAAAGHTHTHTAICKSRARNCARDIYIDAIVYIKLLFDKSICYILAIRGKITRIKIYNPLESRDPFIWEDFFFCSSCVFFTIRESAV